MAYRVRTYSVAGVYLRRERGKGGYWSVTAYRDPECTERVWQWPWWSFHKPDRKHKHVTLSGARYRATWLENV
jgi:hypothetical protein